MPLGKKVAVSVAVFAVLVGGSVAAASAARFYLGSTEQDDAARVCGDHQGTTHRVAIRDGNVRPVRVAAKLCDTLVLENHDNAQRRLAFGEHDHHVDYDGAEGKLVKQGESLTLVLAKTGDFIFHDHFDDRVYGHFTVAE